MAKHEFWTHGIAAVMENKVTGATEVHRSDEGTVYTQPANTENWFHLPIPTPTVINGDSSIWLKQVVLRAFTNDNAKIDAIHVRHQHELAEDIAVSLIGGEHTKTLDITPIKDVDRGLCVSIHVKFLSGSPVGKLILRGAGGVFNTNA